MSNVRSVFRQAEPRADQNDQTPSGPPPTPPILLLGSLRHDYDVIDSKLKHLPECPNSYHGALCVMETTLDRMLNNVRMLVVLVAFGAWIFVWVRCL